MNPASHLQHAYARIVPGLLTIYTRFRVLRQYFRDFRTTILNGFKANSLISQSIKEFESDYLFVLHAKEWLPSKCEDLVHYYCEAPYIATGGVALVF